MAAVSNSTSLKFRSRFWTELQIGDKRVPIIGHLRYLANENHDCLLQIISLKLTDAP